MSNLNPLVDIFLMVAGGILGNRADAAAMHGIDAIAQRVRGLMRTDPPHADAIARVTRMAYLQATQVVCAVCLDAQHRSWGDRARDALRGPQCDAVWWLTTRRDSIKEQLERLRRGEPVSASRLDDADPALLVAPDAADWATLLRTQVLAEFRGRRRPHQFVELITTGWTAPEAQGGARQHWVDLVQAFFLDTLAHDPALATMVEVQLLAGLAQQGHTLVAQLAQVEQRLGGHLAAITAHAVQLAAATEQWLPQIADQLAALAAQERHHTAAIRADLAETRQDIAAVQASVDQMAERAAQPSSAPPPPTPPARHQLRAPTPDFVGRSSEIATLVTTLRQAGGATAISGVQGLGGVGKTELALVVGNQLRDAFPDAQIVLDLRGSRPTEAMSVIQALQSVIRTFVPDVPLPDSERDLLPLYRHVLTDKRVLILADDAHGAAQVRPLLPPRGSVLMITSRSRFRLAGMAPIIDLDTLTPDDAVAFLTRLCPPLSAAQAREVARLCGGLPLALRISGSTLVTSTRPPARYLTALADERRRLAQLRAPNDPDLDVDASLNLSYATLTPAAQQALAQLGVVTGSFDRAAAQAVLAAPDADGVDALLDALHGRSLLEYDAAQDRFSLHELVRVFALARLAEAGLEHDIRLRHAKHYIQLVATADQMYRAGGDHVPVGLALFDRERSNVDTAWAWLQNQPAHPTTDEVLVAAARATAYIGDLRYAKHTERVPQLRAALNAAQRLGDRRGEGSVLGNLGLAYADLGETRRAIECSEHVLVIAREVGDRRTEGTVLSNLGNAYMNLGETQRAIGFFEQHLAVAREFGDRHTEGVVLGNLGNAYMNLGETQRAIGFFEQHLAVAREFGDRRGEGQALGNLGVAYAALGVARTAIDYAEQHLAMAQTIGDRRGEGQALGNIGLACLALGETQRAVSCFEQDLAIVRELGDQRGEGQALGNLGLAYVALAETRRAIRCFEQVLTIAREIGDRHMEGGALGNLGPAHAALGDVQQAISCSAQHLVVARNVGDRRAEGQALGNLGNAYFAIGDVRRAIDFFEQDLAIARKVGDRRGEGQTLGNLGAAYAGLGETQRAIEYLEQNLALARDLGDKHGEGATLGNLGVAYASLGETQRAIEYLEQNLALARKVGDRRGEGLVMSNLGLAYVTQGETQQAIGFYEQSLSILREIGDRRGEAETAWNFGRLLVQDGKLARGQALLEQSLRFHEEINHPHTALMVATLAHVRAHGTLPVEPPRSAPALLAALPAAVSAALVADDSAALQAALAALPPEQAQRISEQLQVAGLISSGPAMARVLQQVAPLLQAIAAIARGERLDERPAVEQALAEAEQAGWMLRAAVERIWQGERDVAALTTGLDTSDSQLVQHLLTLLQTPAPEPLPFSEAVQAALERQDGPALQAALAALPPAAAAAIVAQLERTGQSTVQQRGPDMAQVMQAFTPLLGDIALAAHGDDTARQLAEATLPQLEAQSWRLTDAAQRIWQGERDAAALIAAIDPNSAQLVRRILTLVADGPALIVAAGSRQIAALRHEVNAAVAQALAGDDAAARAVLVEQLLTVAQQADGQPGAPWQDLATYLRAQAATLQC